MFLSDADLDPVLKLSRTQIRIRFSKYGRVRIWFSKLGRIRIRSEHPSRIELFVQYLLKLLKYQYIDFGRKIQLYQVTIRLEPGL